MRPEIYHWNIKKIMAIKLVAENTIFRLMMKLNSMAPNVNEHRFTYLASILIDGVVHFPLSQCVARLTGICD